MLIMSLLCARQDPGDKVMNKDLYFTFSRILYYSVVNKIKVERRQTGRKITS